MSCQKIVNVGGEGVGFGVWDLGFGVWSLGFGVARLEWGLGYDDLIFYLAERSFLNRTLLGYHNTRARTHNAC